MYVEDTDIVFSSIWYCALARTGKRKTVHKINPSRHRCSKKN